MRRVSRKQVSNTIQAEKSVKMPQQQQTYYKISHGVASTHLHPEQKTKIMNKIREQIKRPQTSKRLKSDYKMLMNLMDCSSRIQHSKKQSEITFNQMRNLKKRESSPANMFRPLVEEIQNGQQAIAKKKYERCDLNYFQNKMQASRYQKKALNQLSYQQIKQFKGYIPVKANLNYKLQIFGEITEEERNQHVQKIKKLIARQKQRSPNVNETYQIYLVNHYILQQLMVKVNQNAEGLKLKRRKYEIYKQIKNQMISEIVDEKSFQSVLKVLDQQFQQSLRIQSILKRPKSVMSGVYRKRQPRAKSGKNIQSFEESFEISRPTIKGKQNDISIKFQSLCNQAEQKLAQAQRNLRSFNKINTISVIDYEFL